MDVEVSAGDAGGGICWYLVAWSWVVVIWCWGGGGGTYVVVRCSCICSCALYWFRTDVMDVA